MIDWIEDRVALIIAIATAVYTSINVRKAISETKKSNLEIQKLELELRELRLKNRKNKKD